MRVLLVSMPIEENLRFNTNIDSINYPLGLIYLYSILEKAGHNVDMLFMNNEPYTNAIDKLAKKLRNFNPDVLGVNILTMNRVASDAAIAMLVSPGGAISHFWAQVHM